MPELPEVETVRKQLDKRLRGQIVSEILIFKTGREMPAGDSFIEQVIGSRLVGVGRRAKVLIFQFDDGRAILGHLKMTGKFLFVDKTYSPQKHDRILFVFADGTMLVWSDIRQFGYLKVVSEKELEKEIGKYGPEPLETPVEELANRLLTPKTRKVKAALLDQSTIAGVGNIYADEACHRAGIRPTRRLSTLSTEDRTRLAGEIVSVLTESLAKKGTSANDYVDTEGEKGGFLSLLRVYGRENEPCTKCSKSIKKIVLGGRGTHYCPQCQK